MRVFRKGGIQTTQIVAPIQARQKILFTAHDGLLAGHCGVGKTLGRVFRRFWWPGVFKDVRQYCKNCEQCPNMAKKYFRRGSDQSYKSTSSSTICQGYTVPYSGILCVVPMAICTKMPG